MGGMNQMISEIAGVELPSRKMPAWLALASASLLTGISRLTKKGATVQDVHRAGAYHEQGNLCRWP
jgi:hypothetical protein